jgi:hypothetical protein
MKTRSAIILLLAILTCAVSCRKETSDEGSNYRIRLKFIPKVNGESLVEGKSYLSPLGEDFSISSFKIFIGNISLIQDGAISVARKENEYFLLDAFNPASLVVETALSGNRFSDIGFQIGIDSILNVSGAQTGALDPSTGMFWTWSTGYIMAKLEGNSSYSTGVNKAITYHIGGFKTGENTIRQVVLPVPAQQDWLLEKNNVTEITIEMNIDKWFSSAHNLFIAAQPATMTPGELSIKYADNYARMFAPLSIERTP